MNNNKHTPSPCCCCCNNQSEQRGERHGRQLSQFTIKQIALVLCLLAAMLAIRCDCSFGLSNFNVSLFQLTEQGVILSIVRSDLALTVSSLLHCCPEVQLVGVGCMLVCCVSGHSLAGSWCTTTPRYLPLPAADTPADGARHPHHPICRYRYLV